MRLQALFRFLLLCACASMAWAAGPPGTVTVLEGSGVLTRGTGRYVLAEGVRLQQKDIIELGDKSVALLEFTDGGIVALGPDSRALLLPPAAKMRGVYLFLLRGQAKAAVSDVAYRVATPQIAVTAADATPVLQESDVETALFVEQGEVSVEEQIRGRKRGAAVPVRSGEFYARQSSRPGQVTPRPTGEFVSGLPRLFRERLPSRFDKVKDVDVELKKTREITYADVEPWLKSTTEVRRILVPLWRVMARDADFRKSLVANLKYHWEWDRILFPEKYEEMERRAREAKR